MNRNFDTKDIEYLKSLTDQIQSDHLKSIISKIENLLNEQFDQDQLNKNNTWSGQLMYKHRAFKQPRFIDLGIVIAHEEKDAHFQCTCRAEEMLEEEFREQDMDRLLELWEVRVRPAMN